MTYLKKYGLRLIYTLIAIFILLILSTTLYYFNIINNTFYKIMKIIIVLLSIFINAFILGKGANQKGYLEGLKLGAMIIPIFFILTLITSNPLKLRVILYYMIIMISSIFGSMVGISRKKELKS